MSNITVREARTYTKGGPHSFLLDHMTSGMNLDGAGEARARLEKHADEVRYEIERGSEEGRRAQRTIRQTVSRPEYEVRSGMTTGGAGAQFVSPEWFQKEFGKWLNYPPTFFNAAVQLEDPGYGMQLNLPSVGSASTVTQQTEGTAVGNASPSSINLGPATLVTIAGEVDVSQQLFDRAALNFDRVVGPQLVDDLWTKVDSFAFATALTGVTPLSEATFSVPHLWANLSTVASQMETTSGNLGIMPTHMFMTPPMYRFCLSQMDSGGNRPILTPSPLPPPDKNDPMLTLMGYTGERILDVPVYRDGNIPTVVATPTQTQLVVANMNEIFAQCSEPAVRVVHGVSGLGQQLTVAIQSYCYVGLVVRHAGAIQTISGAAYPAAPTFGN